MAEPGALGGEGRRVLGVFPEEGTIRVTHGAGSECGRLSAESGHLGVSLGGLKVP